MNTRLVLCFLMVLMTTRLVADVPSQLREIGKVYAALFGFQGVLGQPDTRAKDIEALNQRFVGKEFRELEAIFSTARDLPNNITVGSHRDAKRGELRCQIRSVRDHSSVIVTTAAAFNSDGLITRVSIYTSTTGVD